MGGQSNVTVFAVESGEYVKPTREDKIWEQEKIKQNKNRMCNWHENYKICANVQDNCL